MKRSFIVKHGDKYYQCTRVDIKKKPSFFETVYGLLNAAEVCAVKLAKINQLRKGFSRYNTKKSSKTYKIDKKTGTLILKKAPRCKSAKPIKRRSL